MIIQERPLLVFGGPYSNLQATEALFAEAERRGIAPKNIVCTGDVVAYAANPEETARIVRDACIQVVAGNCEVQLSLEADDCACGFEADSACARLSRGWYPFALAKTSKATRTWMAGLPARLDFEFAGLRVAVLHGGARQNNRFLFASETDALEAEFALAEADKPCDLVVTGHAGIPFIEPLSRGTWLNAGVIGMPANDGTPDGWFAELTPSSDGVHIQLCRLSFDHAAAAAAMRRSGHANGYARTLITGIWPSLDILPDAEKLKTGEPLLEEKAFSPALPSRVEGDHSPRVGRRFLHGRLGSSATQ